MKKAKVTALLLSASIMSGLCFQNVYADEGNEADKADKALFTLCFDGNKNEKLIESEFKNIFEKRYKEAGVLYLYEKGKNLYVGVTHPDCFLANYESVFSADGYEKIYIFKSQCNWVWNNNIVSFTKEEATKIEALNDEKIEIITATYADSYKLNKVKQEKEEAIKGAEEAKKEKEEAVREAEEKARKAEAKAEEKVKEAKENAKEIADEAKKEKEKAVREAKEKVKEVQENAEKIANEAKIAQKDAEERADTAKKAQKDAEENERIANNAKDEAVKGKKSAVRDKYVILATSGVFVALENLYLIFQDEVTQAYNWSKGLVSHFFNLLKK